MKPFWITSHGQAMSANLFMPEPPRQPEAFLFIQGWMGSQNVQGAQALMDRGYTCLTYDMRGNHDSEGDLAKLSRAEFLEDAVIAYDELRLKLEPGTAISCIGSSFGSYLAVLLSRRRPLKRLSLRVPANYPDDSFTEPLQPSVGSDALAHWRRQPLTHHQNEALSALHSFKGEILVIESEADHQVDHQTVQNYVNACSEPSKLSYHLMRQAPHSLINQALQAEYQSILTSWVDNAAGA